MNDIDTLFETIYELIVKRIETQDTIDSLSEILEENEDTNIVKFYSTEYGEKSCSIGDVRGDLEQYVINKEQEINKINDYLQNIKNKGNENSSNK